MRVSGLTASTASNCNHDDHILRCVEFVRNYDGDTFTVNIPESHPLLGDEITVRVSNSRQF